MRFYTTVIGGSDELLVSFDGGKTAYTLTSLGMKYKSLNEIFNDGTDEAIDELKKIAASEIKAQPLTISELKLEAPIPEPMQDVACLGINYDEHAREAGRFSDEAFGGERPYTIYFAKRVTRATGDGDAIPSYTGYVDSLDYECELGVVLGKTVKDISVEEADSCIFGYMIINDVSARNVQTRHKQWYKGKSLDGHTPMGPCIVTKDEMGDAANKAIKCYVNGELRQNSNTKFMIQTVNGAISELSQGMTLKAGTIIATGTPAGVGMGMQPPCFLKPGDVVTCEIETIGTLSNTVE